MSTEYPSIPPLFLPVERDAFPSINGEEYATPEFNCLVAAKWEFTPKVVGTHVRIIYTAGNKSRLEFLGRTDNDELPKEIADKLREHFSALKAKLKLFTPGLVLYGVYYEKKIQTSPLDFRYCQGFYVFDAKKGDEWQSREELTLIANMLNLCVIPVIKGGEVGIHHAVNMVKLDTFPKSDDYEVEGIVAKPKALLFMQSGERVIARICVKDFLKANP